MIQTLNHEVFDDSVESASFEVFGDSGRSRPRLSGAKRAKVFGSFGDDVHKEFKEDAAEGSSALGHVEPNARVGSRHGFSFLVQNTKVEQKFLMKKRLI